MFHFPASARPTKTSWHITTHAIKRYRKRIDPFATDAESLEAIAFMILTAKTAIPDANGSLCHQSGLFAIITREDCIVTLYMAAPKRDGRSRRTTNHTRKPGSRQNRSRSAAPRRH